MLTLHALQGTELLSYKLSAWKRNPLGFQQQAVLQRRPRDQKWKDRHNWMSLFNQPLVMTTPSRKGWGA